MERTTHEKSRRTVEARPEALRAVLVGVELPEATGVLSLEDSLAELEQLAQTVGLTVVGRERQKLRAPNPATFIGKGKVEQLAALAADNRADVVIFDDELSPGQQRNLEEATKVAVIDRSQVILDVFAQRARTHEGRLQVQLAATEYQLPRLAGAWTHLSRQFGGIGARGGPGETQLETDRRLVRHNIAELKRQIERVRDARRVHREHRREGGMLLASLVGYTNAGKSTLFNALTRAGVSAQDRPFETLDPTTRRLRLPSGQTILLSDTVGFIQKLPVTLIAAFRATLEELESADLLLHVLDVTHPRGYEQGLAVEQTLNQLSVAQKPRVTALNKIDQLQGVEPEHGVVGAVGSALDQLEAHYPNAVAISAARGIGLDRLTAQIELVLAARVTAE